jgi:D-sedoheptulose 7-phosphate isomerase
MKPTLSPYPRKSARSSESPGDSVKDRSGIGCQIPIGRALITRPLRQLLVRRPELTECRVEIYESLRILERCFRLGRRVYLCGNGGSAADCEHWAGELLKGFCSKRIPSRAMAARLPVSLRQLQGGLPAIPLTGFLSLRTAFGNDIASELEFAQLAWVLGRPGDVLICLSTSGNARNVFLAAKAARAVGMEIIGLSGSNGGLLRTVARPCICAPVKQTHLIQEMHLSIYHALCLALEETFFPEAPLPKH